jgi:LytS/YehU family sensor histidine kinase
MVSGLSELLRFSLGSAGEQEIPLERELEVLQHYLDIQQVRFQDRLSVSFDVEEDAERAFVPNLLLQPLVENAIKHGLSPRVAAGHIIIRARRRDDVLALEVLDDGVGEPAEEVRREGVGLGNSRARLRSLYGDAHVFEAGARTDGGGSGRGRGGALGGMFGRGFRVYIELPFHTKPIEARELSLVTTSRPPAA